MDQGHFDPVSYPDAKPLCCLCPDVHLVLFEIPESEGRARCSSEAVEALHGGCIHTKHVHLWLTEIRLRRGHWHALLGERRDARDALDLGEVAPDLADE